VILIVKIIPNASKNSLEGFQEGILKIKIQASPDKGKANEALVEFLAETLEVPKREIRILSGHTSRLKKIDIPPEASKKLARL